MKTLPLRLLLALIDAGAWLAPPSRRREWRQQWRADILHEWRWLARQDHGVVERATLVRRTAGALCHALWLRGHVRRLEMITHDLRYGWRQMVRRPGITLAAVVVVMARLVNVITPVVALADTEFPVAEPALGVATTVIVPAGTALPN